MLKDEIIRIVGRTKNALIDTDAKHPVILQNKHHLTDLIVHRYYENLGHSGREHVLSNIRTLLDY